MVSFCIIYLNIEIDNQMYLIWMICTGHEKIVKLLIENGADIKSKSGQSAVQLAKEKGK